MMTLDRESVERVVKLTRQGKSQRFIADEVGITTRTVCRIRAREGISRHDLTGPDLTADELTRAAELLDDGCSFAEVGRTIGRSASTIARNFPGRGFDRYEASQRARLGRLAREVLR